MLYLAAMTGFFFYTSQYMQGVLGFTALAAGLGFLPMSVVNFAVALGVGRVPTRLGPAGTLLAGVVLTLVGMFWLARIGVGSSYWTAVAAPMVLIGAGQGLVFAPVTAFGLADVDSDDAGAASGLINTFHQMGATLGLGLMVAVSAHAGTARTSTGTAGAAAALTGRVHTALQTGSGLLAAATVTVIALLMAVPTRRTATAAAR